MNGVQGPLMNAHTHNMSVNWNWKPMLNWGFQTWSPATCLTAYVSPKKDKRQIKTAYWRAVKETLLHESPSITVARLITSLTCNWCQNHEMDPNDNREITEKRDWEMGNIREITKKYGRNFSEIIEKQMRNARNRPPYEMATADSRLFHFFMKLACRFTFISSVWVYFLWHAICCKIILCNGR